MLALTGRTGAGKTSIVNVLNRFYEINSGSITVGKKNINKISIANLRENIALVQQEVFLFSDTLYNNITLFENNISKEDVMIAAKEIGIDAFISSLPNGLDYIVAERGVSLSAGQRQLIAFLRVYVRNPKILILDEATASIDSETESLLQSALMKISNNRTTIVIAHRLSTVVNSDKILYLENGSVLESGSHQDLLDVNGLYAKAFNSQVEKKL
jgi:ABC-type multidrug transport system fused ATPase/permease subunit